MELIGNIVKNYSVQMVIDTQLKTIKIFKKGLIGANSSSSYSSFSYIKNGVSLARML